MAKAVSNIRKTQTAHSWGILLGMLGFPVTALFSKVFPQYDTGWEVLLAVCCLVIVRSVVGYLFPGAGAKKAEHAVTQTR
jgi:hypothetical protein